MADFLEDDDPSEMAEHRFGQQEWDKLEETFVNAGYREGITAGKEEALQEGFDAGFAEHGAPLGREIGKMRGIAAACLLFVHRSASKSNSDNNLSTSFAEVELARVRQLESAKSIVGELAALKLPDLIPPDVEAMEHAREHANDDGRTEAAGNADVEMQEALRKWEAGKTQLADLRARLQILLKELELAIEV